MYPEISDARGSRRSRRSHRLHRRRRLAENYGFKVGDTIVLQSAFRSTARRTSTFTIRGIYRPASSAVDNQSMMFHWKYADERSAQGAGRLVVAQIADPDAARRSRRHRPEVRQLAVRDQDRHREGVSASFASMLGNLNSCSAASRSPS
jgi:hypothetical protein